MPSAQELEEQLKAQREALAQSVDDLAERVNPKAQAKEKAEQVRAKAAEPVWFYRQGNERRRTHPG